MLELVRKGILVGLDVGSFSSHGQKCNSKSSMDVVHQIEESLLRCDGTIEQRRRKNEFFDSLNGII